MERDEALTRLLALKGKDLRPLADQYGVTVWTARKTLNKGWVGHTVERVLGIPPELVAVPQRRFVGAQNNLLEVSRKWRIRAERNLGHHDDQSGPGSGHPVSRQPLVGETPKHVGLGTNLRRP